MFGEMNEQIMSEFTEDLTFSRKTKLANLVFLTSHNHNWLNLDTHKKILPHPFISAGEDVHH